MSIPTLSNNIIQAQNIVINHNQVPIPVMSNGSNGIPIATALTHAPTAIEQGTEIKTGIVVETIPLAEPMQGARLVGVHTVPVQNTSPAKTVTTQAMNSQVQTAAAGKSEYLEIQKLLDLVRDVDPNLTLEDEVEELILSYVDEFVDRVLNGARMIAMHRQVKTIEVKDVQQFLNRNYSMWAPGLGTDELKPYKRNLTNQSHKDRLSLIRRALKKY